MLVIIGTIIMVPILFAIRMAINDAAYAERYYRCRHCGQLVLEHSLCPRCYDQSGDATPRRT